MEALSKGESGARAEAEHFKIKFQESDRNYQDLLTELEKEKALWNGKFEWLERQKEQYKKDAEEAQVMFQSTV